MDGTWGMIWDGSFQDVISGWSNESAMRGNLLFVRLLDNYHDEIVARYTELREGILSRRNIERQFSDFIGGIPDHVYAAEAEKWPSAPSISVNNLSQIMSFADARIESLDTAFGVDIEEKTESAWRVAFACENGAKVSVYPTQDYSVSPVRAASAYSVNGSTGALTKSGGQVNFKVEVPEGYTATVEAFPQTAYTNLKTPADTGSEDTYRITKIKDDLTVRVRLDEDIPEPEGWNVTFECDPGVDVFVYPGADYSAPAQKKVQTVSVDSGTGTPTKTDGQVNFRLSSANALDAYEISVSPDKYKNLKGPDETGQNNTYRITKIKGDLTVTVHLIKHEHSAARTVRRDVVANTCTEGGSYAVVTLCECGQELSREVFYTEPTGHCWGDWTVVREATASRAGLMERVCLNDPDHVETDTIPMLEPTFANGGYLSRILGIILEFFRKIIAFFS